MAHSAKNLQGIATAVFQRSTIFILAQVSQGTNKSGQQIAVGTVQFQPIKTSCVCTQRGLHKCLQHLGHGFWRHGLRQWVVWTIGLRTGGQQWPVVLRQRFIDGLPAQLGGTFRATVPELQADMRVLLVHEIGDALKCQLLRLIPQPRATGRDAAIRCRAGHLDHDQTCTTHGSGA